MSPKRSYASPTAFRRALTDKPRAAASNGRWALPQLQRQIAYDRLLARLYAIDDIDVYRTAEIEAAEADLRTAAEIELDDWFHFEVGAPRALADAARGRRLPITALIGTAAWAQFHLDLIGPGVQMTGEPEPVPALAAVPGLFHR